MLKVGFICVHNSCRSQIAEALGKKIGVNVFESYSAGTEVKPEINQDAVRIMKEIYSIDMEESQKSKLLRDIPARYSYNYGLAMWIVHIYHKHREDWGLDDPTGKSDEEFIKTIKLIENKLYDLKDRIENGIIFIN